jgi:CHAT domain-containing protein
MSIEEAKKVTAAFSAGAFVPPPRTISDITAILDQQKRADPQAAAQARAKADQPPPPPTGDPGALAAFYYRRGLAARETGRLRQEIDDLTRALEWSGRAAGGGGIRYDDVAWELARAELSGGNLLRASGYLRQSIAATPRGASIRAIAMLVRLQGRLGDFDAAEAATRELLALVAESRTRRNLPPEWVAFYNAQAAEAQGRLAELRGRFAEAEAFYREAIAELARDPTAAKSPVVEYRTADLAVILSRQGRVIEAEKEARAALLGALSRYGRYSTHTADILRTLVHVIFEQGRYADAETLARARIEIYEKTGSSSDSVSLTFSRAQLGDTLGAQGRWREALGEYEAIRAGLQNDRESFQTFFGAHVGWAVALLRSGQPDQALEILKEAMERSRRLVGEKHPRMGRIRGLLATAYAAKGDRARALKEFAEATQVLLTRSPEDADDESGSRPAQDRRLNMMLTSYMGLLADIHGATLAQQAGVDAAAEAFRLAEVARGRSVQRALDASAARTAAGTPALAELVRKEQDAKKQIGALHGLLANLLTAPTDQQDPKVMASLRAQIDALRRAREALSEQIAKEFPAYAQLLNPPPATVEQARAGLRPGEALIATYVARDRAFVWAIPHRGAVAFAATPVGERALESAVTELRKALDPSAKTLGDIPAFDLALAHRLYRELLDPVKPGWQGADSLLVVPHGPLGQLPFALLLTKPATLAPEPGPIFANYRALPWLTRSHAVTVLPSVSSLATLRALPPGDPSRRPFIGFGDPYFNEEQARRAARRTPPAEAAALATRGVPITLRSSPKTQGFDSSQLAMLPRLPDTADEIRSIALAMNADLTRDVFTGAQANEKTVKTLDLSGYRVLAFATHGLVPGDLDGLTQPALALAAPDVAQVDGDGLLTMEEILSLRLNADWVVLSACNTASGKGAGAEAISGLGRAFFYAGARALLVSNWPVETTSARALTTDVFRRQQADPGVPRAKALQATMNWLMDDGAFVDPRTKTVVFSYAHPIFWAPFTLVGDGGGGLPPTR